MLLKEFLVQMGFDAHVEVFEGELVMYNILCPDARLLIGEEGKNVRAVEFLFKKVMPRDLRETETFVIDVDSYRRRRLEALKEEVRSFAQRVRLQGKEVMLEPLPSYERRAVHMALAEYPDIVTESIGEEPNRRVIIKPYP